MDSRLSGSGFFISDRDPGYKKHWISEPQQKVTVNFSTKNLYQAVGNMTMKAYSECEKGTAPWTPNPQYYKNKPLEAVFY